MDRVDLGHEIPSVFSDFLKRANGLRVFSGHLYICGLRTNYARSGAAAWQPYSILTPNLHERPRNAKTSHFFIGGHEPYGYRLYMDTASGHVYRCTERSVKPKHEWPSFEDMLESEMQRLALLFDGQGRQIDPEQPTTK